MRQKSIVFLRLFNYYNKKQLNRKVTYLIIKVKRIVNKINQNNLLRKSLKAWKVFSFHESNVHFENKIRERTELELKNYETTLVHQQEKILELISKAEEKLKLEQKKKNTNQITIGSSCITWSFSLKHPGIKIISNCIKR